MSASGEHDSFIKTPRQLITVVVLSFVVPILIIVLLVKYVGAGARPAAGTDALTPEAVEARIQPVARFELKGAGGPKVLRAGEDVYKAQCAACHAVGAAGAPKTGDAGAWAARLKTGYDALLNSALKGKGAMAAQGGGEYDDLEIGRAVVHMANASGGKLAEPKAPAAEAAKDDAKK
jgi:cytochrome c5